MRCPSRLLPRCTQQAFEGLKRGEGVDPGLPRFAGRAVAADQLSRRVKATLDAVQAITA